LVSDQSSAYQPETQLLMDYFATSKNEFCVNGNLSSK